MHSTNPAKNGKEKPQPIERDPPVSRKKIRREKADDCISVYCRIRPREPTDEPNKSTKRCYSDMLVIPEENTIELLADSTGRPIDKKYTFTKLFQDQPQAVVTQGLCGPLLQAVLAEAKGGLIFAYGVTSSGKTHTILGSVQEPGILEFFFRQLPKPFELTAVEVYNDEFFPLVGVRTRLRLIESSGKLEFADYSPVMVEEADINSILEQVKENRAQRNTNFNSKSSRSHAIFRICFDGKVIGVVDLAGSERNREGCSQEETTNINISLLTLGRCITCLREVKHDRNVQIPFRDSRLTMALAEYFNPDFKLVMLINVNPSKAMQSETMNVLEYAAIAKNIKPSANPIRSRWRPLPNTQSSFDQPDIFEESKSVYKSKQKYEEEGGNREENKAAFRDLLIKNNVEMMKEQYIERHRIMNEDFNIFFDKEIEAERERDREIFKRLNEATQNDHESVVRVTSTCVNTTPLKELELASAFKLKTIEEMKEEYHHWLDVAKKTHEEELEQERSKREILERMYHDELEQLNKLRQISKALEEKFEVLVGQRQKMEMDAEEFKKAIKSRDDKLEHQRQEAEERAKEVEQQLRVEISARKKEQQAAQKKIRKILEEKDVTCVLLIQEKEQMLGEIKELKRKRELYLEEERRREEEKKALDEEVKRLRRDYDFQKLTMDEISSRLDKERKAKEELSKKIRADWQLKDRQDRERKEREEKIKREYEERQRKLEDLLRNERQEHERRLASEKRRNEREVQEMLRHQEQRRSRESRERKQAQQRERERRQAQQKEKERKSEERKQKEEEKEKDKERRERKAKQEKDEGLLAEETKSVKRQATNNSTLYDLRHQQEADSRDMRSCQKGRKGGASKRDNSKKERSNNKSPAEKIGELSKDDKRKNQKASRKSSSPQSREQNPRSKRSRHQSKRVIEQPSSEERERDPTPLKDRLRRRVRKTKNDKESDE